MHILHIISEFDHRSGGAAVAMFNMAEAQQRSGLTVSIVATTREPKEPARAETLRDTGGNICVLPNAQGALYKHENLTQSLNAAVERADIVQVHGLWEQIQYEALTIAQANRKPTCLTPHGMLSRWSLAQKKWKKKAYIALRLKPALRRCDTIHFTTPYERDATSSRFYRKGNTIIPLSIDVERIRSDAAETQSLPEPLRDALTPPAVAFLGRIYPGKGAEHLVEAWPHLQNPHAKLVLIGPEQGPLGDELRARARVLGCLDRVIFAGAVYPPELFAALQSATLFCLPSDHENFGLAAAEAMAAGAPTLLSAEVALSSHAVAASAAALVPREPRTLAAEIDKWLDDGAGRARLSSVAAAYSIGTLSHAAVGQQWTHLYESLLT